MDCDELGPLYIDLRDAIAARWSVTLQGATANALQNARSRVFGTSRRTVAKGSAGATMLSCDVTDEAPVVTLVDEVLAETGRTDLPVKHARAGLLAGAEESSAGQGQALFDVNVFNILRITNLVLPIKLREWAAATEVHMRDGVGSGDAVVKAATAAVPRRGYATGRPTRQVRIMRRFVPNPLSTRVCGSTTICRSDVDIDQTPHRLMYSCTCGDLTVMGKPIVGVIGSAYSIHDVLNVQHVGEHNLRCISDVADALPLMFAGCPGITDIGALLDTVDGILLTGARANVHPTCFGVDPDARYEPYDRDRDAIALPLVRACTERGVPLLGICRGLQEMNVAFGGSLHPEVRDLPGRMNHRAPRAEDGSLHRDPNVIFADRHDVRFVADSVIARLLGRLTVRVNSLHGQAILALGDRVVVEGVAEDGTIEAIRIAGASSFALGVQWHAEVDAHTNPVNRTLFRAFGAALRQGNRRIG
jgi:putative glutamine amidotransferase